MNVIENLERIAEGDAFSSSSPDAITSLQVVNENTDTAFPFLQAEEQLLEVTNEAEATLVCPRATRAMPESYSPPHIHSTQLSLAGSGPTATKIHTKSIHMSAPQIAKSMHYNRSPALMVDPPNLNFPLNSVAPSAEGGMSISTNLAKNTSVARLQRIDGEVEVTVDVNVTTLGKEDGVQVLPLYHGGKSDTRSTKSTSASLLSIASKVGTKVLDSIDYIGSTLAYLFGITSPRYEMYLEDAEDYQTYLKTEAAFKLQKKPTDELKYAFKMEEGRVGEQSLTGSEDNLVVDTSTYDVTRIRDENEVELQVETNNTYGLWTGQERAPSTNASMA